MERCLFTRMLSLPVVLNNMDCRQFWTGNPMFCNVDISSLVVPFPLWDNWLMMKPELFGRYMRRWEMIVDIKYACTACCIHYTAAHSVKCSWIGFAYLPAFSLSSCSVCVNGAVSITLDCPFCNVDLRSFSLSHTHACTHIHTHTHHTTPHHTHFISSWCSLSVHLSPALVYKTLVCPLTLATADGQRVMTSLLVIWSVQKSDGLWSRQAGMG